MKSALVVAIHGVGDHTPGHIQESMRRNLKEYCDQVEIEEFHWSNEFEMAYDKNSFHLNADAVTDVGIQMITAASLSWPGAPFYWKKLVDPVEQLIFVVGHMGLAAAVSLFVLTNFMGCCALVSTPLINEILTASTFAGLLFGITCLLLVCLGIVCGIVSMSWAPISISIRKVVLLAISPLLIVSLLPLSKAELLNLLQFGLGEREKFRALSELIVRIGFLVAVPVSLLSVGLRVRNTAPWISSVCALLLVTLIFLWISLKTRFYLAGAVRIVLDVTRYFGDAECRDTLQRRLQIRFDEWRSHGIEDLIVVSHSLGTVLVVDFLANGGDCTGFRSVTLITMGSPLRRLIWPFFPNYYFPNSAQAIQQAIRRTTPNFRWFNIFRPLDPVGRRIGFLNADVGIESSTGQYFHFNAHPDYWSDEKVKDIAVKFVRTDAREIGPVTTGNSQVFARPELPAHLRYLGTNGKVISYLLTTISTLAITVWLANIQYQSAVKRQENFQLISERGEQYTGSVHHKRSIRRVFGQNARVDVIDHFELTFTLADGSEQKIKWTNLDGMSTGLVDGRALLKDIYENGEIIKGKKGLLLRESDEAILRNVKLKYHPEVPSQIVLPGYERDLAFDWVGTTFSSCFGCFCMPFILVIVANIVVGWFLVLAGGITYSSIEESMYVHSIE